MVVMPSPSRRGRKKKTLSTVGAMGGPGNETFILAHLTAGGQVRKATCKGTAFIKTPSKNRFYFDR